MKLHLPLSLYRLLLFAVSCLSVSYADIAIPEDYTQVRIDSADDFASFTPEESVNYAFIVADGVTLSPGAGETLLPDGRVIVQGEGSLSFTGAEGENRSHLFDGDSLVISSKGPLTINGFWSPVESYGSASVHNYTVIKAKTFTLEGCTDTVSFSSNSSDNRGVITLGQGGTATIAGNASVSFDNNELRSTAGKQNYANTAQGAAIHVGSGATLNVENNAEVSFTNNVSTQAGGALYGYNGYIGSKGDPTGVLNFSENGTVLFSGNSAKSGGAIHGADMSFTNNGEVIFSENSASGSGTPEGGALWVYDGGTALFSGNDRVVFQENTSAGYGGAIMLNGSKKSDVSAALQISGNKEVAFIGNSSSKEGGAIYSKFRMVEISGNETVEFTDNKAGRAAGAIYGTTVKISGNDSVTFKGNYSETRKVGSTDYTGAVMRAIYIEGGTDFEYNLLELSANEGGHITFYDSVYATGLTNDVALNKEGSGDIVFSGKYAVENVNALSDGAASAEQIEASLTSEMDAAVVLYAGRLRVEDGATLRSKGLTVGGGGGHLWGNAFPQGRYHRPEFQPGTTLVDP